MYCQSHSAIHQPHYCIVKLLSLLRQTENISILLLFSWLRSHLTLHCECSEMVKHLQAIADGWYVNDIGLYRVEFILHTCYINDNWHNDILYLIVGTSSSIICCWRHHCLLGLWKMFFFSFYFFIFFINSFFGILCLFLLLLPLLLKDVRLSENPIADPGRGGIPRFVLIARLKKVEVFNGSEVRCTYILDGFLCKLSLCIILLHFHGRWAVVKERSLKYGKFLLFFHWLVCALWLLLVPCQLFLQYALIYFFTLFFWIVFGFLKGKFAYIFCYIVRPKLM